MTCTQALASRLVSKPLVCVGVVLAADLNLGLEGAAFDDESHAEFSGKNGIAIVEAWSRMECSKIAAITL
jgi:hypothetical protein